MLRQDNFTKFNNSEYSGVYKNKQNWIDRKYRKA